MTKIKAYASLMRFDKPIGFFLLLWPTLWALWLAAAGMPPLSILLIFTAGVFIMRPAGCVINDITDRVFDGHVARTRLRPLVTGDVSVKEAWVLFILLCLMGLFLVLQLNRLTIGIACLALLLSSLYPLMKRYLSFPQLILGLAWYLGVLMGFTAILGHLTWLSGFVYGIAVLWTLIFDTYYAMADQADDIKLGLHSTAILFQPYEREVIGLLQFLFLGSLIALGVLEQLSIYYYLCCFIVLLLMIYQQYLIAKKEPARCFQAFKNNHWVGLVIFIGIFASLT